MSIATVPRMAEAVQKITVHSTLRPATRPPCAASALLAMPTTSKATTSGITVILSPFSHKVPTKSAVPSAAERTPGLIQPAVAPSPTPAMSAASAQ